MLHPLPGLGVALLVLPLDVLVQPPSLLEVLVLPHQRPALLLPAAGELRPLALLGQLAVVGAVLTPGLVARVLALPLALLVVLGSR